MRGSYQESICRDEKACTTRGRDGIGCRRSYQETVCRDEKVCATRPWDGIGCRRAWQGWADCGASLGLNSWASRSASAICSCVIIFSRIGRNCFAPFKPCAEAKVEIFVCLHVILDHALALFIANTEVVLRQLRHLDLRLCETSSTLPWNRALRLGLARSTRRGCIAPTSRPVRRLCDTSLRLLPDPAPPFATGVAKAQVELGPLRRFDLRLCETSLLLPRNLAPRPCRVRRKRQASLEPQRFPALQAYACPFHGFCLILWDAVSLCVANAEEEP